MGIVCRQYLCSLPLMPFMGSGQAEVVKGRSLEYQARLTSGGKRGSC